MPVTTGRRIVWPSDEVLLALADFEAADAWAQEQGDWPADH